MTTFESFAQAYKGGLIDILENGKSVPSVVDPLSKASDFGKSDRPSRELLGHSFEVSNPRSCFASAAEMPISLAYAYGLLAWSLDGRNDVESLTYYRSGAAEYSDDEHTLSGAFGQRLLASADGGDQLAAIIKRIKADPSHRRTFATVLSASDNFSESREYPCAVGVQLFLRDGALTWISVMRAQQALTVLPYDAFLFMAMHQVAAALLEVAVGPYIHQAGTFHIYENEIEIASRLVNAPVHEVTLPSMPDTADLTSDAVRDLITVEREFRNAVLAKDLDKLEILMSTPLESAFADSARSAFAEDAQRRFQT
jgi:thymidylate synthase